MAARTCLAAILLLAAACGAPDPEDEEETALADVGPVRRSLYAHERAVDTCVQPGETHAATDDETSEPRAEPPPGDEDEALAACEPVPPAEE